MADGNNNIPGIGEVLEIDKTTIENLDKAQTSLTQMADAAERIARSMGTISVGLTSIQTKLKASSMEAVFDDTGVMRNFKTVTDVAVKTNQTMQRMSQQTVASEDALTRKWDRIMTARADSASTINTRLRQIADYQQAFQRANAKAIETGGGPLDDTAYQQSIKYAEQLTQRMKDLHLEYDRMAAENAVQKALSMPDNTAAETQAKIKAITEAIAEVNKPGPQAAANAKQNTSWIGQLNAEADAAIARLGKLKEAEKEAQVIAKQTAQYRNLASAYQSIKNLPGDDIEELENKLKSFRELYRKVKQSVDKNPLVTNIFAEDVLRDIKAVEQEMVRLSQLTERNDIKAGLQNAFTGTSKTLDELQDRYKTITELIERAKKAFEGDTNEEFWLGRQVKHAEKLKQSLDGVKLSLDTCERSASKVGSAIKTAFATLAIGTFVKSVVAVRGEFEMAERSLAVIIQDSARAREMFGQIQKIAIKSPFQVKDLVKQTKQLAAYRIETDKLVETTRMLGDISAGVGVDMQRLILAYGQVKAATFLKGTELRQFSEAGVNMLGGLSERLTELQGRFVSTGEVMQMVSKRMISFEDVDAVLRAQTRAGGAFYKMQEKQAETIQGKISNIKDRLDIMYNQIGQSSTGAIHSVIDTINWFVSNYEMIVGIVSAGAIYKAVTALIGGILKLNKAMKALQAIWAATNVSFTSFAMNAAKAGPIIAVVAAAVGAAIMVISELNRANRELRNNARETQKSTDEMLRSYERLTTVISSNVKPLKERQEAFDELKATFGKILPLEKDNVDTIKKGSDAYIEQIALIKEYNAEQLRQKNLQTLLSNDENQTDKRVKRIAKALTGARYYPEIQKLLSDSGRVDKDIIAEVYAGIRKQVLEGEIESASDAVRTFSRKLEEYYTGDEGGALEKILFGDSVTVGTELESTLERQFSPLFDLFDKIETEENKLFPDLRWGAEGKEIRRDIQNIQKEYEKFINKYTGEKAASLADGVFDFSSNPTLLKKKAEEYVATLIQEIEKKIEATPAPETHKDFWLKQLGLTKGQLLTRAGSMEEALDAFYTEMNSRLAGRANITFGVGDLMKKPEEDMKTYGQRVKSYFDKADESVKIHTKNIKQVRETTKGGFWDPAGISLINQANQAIKDNTTFTLEAGQAMQEVKPIAEGFLTTFDIGAWLTKKDQTAAANAYKSSLQNLISTLRGASKEMDSLDEKGQELLEQKIKAIAKRLKIKVPESYADDVLEEWVRSLRKSNKINEEEMLDILIPMRKDAIGDRISEITQEVSGMWDKYNTAKKADEWGINLGSDFNTGNIYAQILAKERELREINTEESNRAAEEIKKRRLEILRSEQEAAAKLIYESEKKVLSKTKQAYASMYEDIRKMREDSNAPELDSTIRQKDIDAAVESRMAKAAKEVAEAQWDAYKGTQSYIMAFGDLDNLSVDVLKALKTDLEAFSKMDLKPADAKAVAVALGKITSEIEGGGGKIKSFSDGLGDGFRKIAKASELFGELPGYIAEFSAASSVANEKLAEQQTAFEAVKNATKAAESAQAKYDAAVRANAENPTQVNNDAEIAAKTELDEANYNLLRSQQYLTAATDSYDKAADKANDAGKKVKDTQEEANRSLQNSGKNLQALSNSYDKIKDAISTTISFAEELTEAFGGTFSPETKAAIDGFTKGIALVSSAMSVLTSIQTAYNAAVVAGEVAVDSFMSVAWPMLVIGAALGVIVAAIKAQDASLESTVKEHKEHVDNLKHSYDKLSDGIKRALTISDAYGQNIQMIRNLNDQVDELNEALAASEQRKDNDSTKEERKSLVQDIENTKKAIADARNEWMEMMGATGDWSGLQSSWASDWLDAYKETGDGLAALKEDFDKFWDGIISEQVARVAFSDLIAKYKATFERILADGRVTMEEAGEVNAMKQQLSEASEQAKRLVRSLGVTAANTTDDNTLQRGIQTVTEQTASAVEGLLNSTRYYVADNNALLRSWNNFLAMDGEDTIMSNMRAQTQYLRSLSQIASSVYSSANHPKGTGGIRVFVD